MPDNVAEYQVIINWEDPQTTVIGDFENDLDSWVPNTGVIMDRNNTQVHQGSYSAEFRADVTDTMLFDDDTVGFDDGVFGSDVSPEFIGVFATRTLTGLTSGRSYVVNAWVYVTFTTRHVKLNSTSALYATESNVFNQWIMLETSFTASGSTHDVWIESVPGTLNNATVFLDNVSMHVAGDDITDLVLGNRGAIGFREGRDQARSLSAIAPSSTEFELINENRIYSPNNPASVLFSNPAAGSPVEIRAIFEGRFYTLYKGFVDDFNVIPELPGFSTIDISSFDQVGRMGSQVLSTALYKSLRTGEIVNIILDEIGWPSGDRIIDAGATTVSWWWAEEETALEAITKIVQAEGIPAFTFIDEIGNFVFRDRHHRYILDDSVNLTAGFLEIDP